MSTDRVIVEHKDGRRYSVPANDPRTKEDGWAVEGAETDAAFVPVGIPKQKAPRKRPGAKNATPIKPPAVSVDTEAPG